MPGAEGGTTTCRHAAAYTSTNHYARMIANACHASDSTLVGWYWAWLRLYNLQKAIQIGNAFNTHQTHAVPRGTVLNRIMYLSCTNITRRSSSGDPQSSSSKQDNPSAPICNRAHPQASSPALSRLDGWSVASFKVRIVYPGIYTQPVACAHAYQNP